MTKSSDPNFLVEALNYRSKNENLRQLELSPGKIDFWSNDYLGYSKINLEKNILKVDNAYYGSTGSRLISGNSKSVMELEAYLAKFHRDDAALVFNSGYNANIGIMSSVPQRGDLILYDELIHASLYDGIRLSYAKRFKFAHNDVDSLNELIQRNLSKFKNIFIVVEGVYSMDGDVAPLEKIAKLRDLYPNLYLIIDEAHSLGVFGKEGGGLVDSLGLRESFFARIFTYGKSLGCHGAAIVGSEVLKNYLVNFSRAFIYTTALPESSIERIRLAYSYLEKRLNFEELHINIAYFKSKSQGRFDFIASDTPIQSLICGSNRKASELEQILIMENFNVKGIKSPTVKSGCERIRFCIHSFNSKLEIDRLFEVLTRLEQ